MNFFQSETVLSNIFHQFLATYCLPGNSITLSLSIIVCICFSVMDSFTYMSLRLCEMYISALCPFMSSALCGQRVWPEQFQHTWSKNN